MQSLCEGVILAAGLSQRAGGFKPALPLGDKTVLQRTIESMATVASRILVVAGWQAEQVRALVAPYPQVELTLNKDFQSGMFSSVCAGLAQVRAPRCFLLPGDYPLVQPETYRHLLAIEALLVVPTYQGRKGHPLLLDSVLIPEILNEPPNSSLRDYVTRRGYTPVEVPDRGILLDVDTPEDYNALKASLLQGG